MTMKEKYEPTLQQMRVEVVDRVRVANGKFGQKQQEYLECEQHIADLKETARTARGKLLEVGRILITMYFKRTETPEEMEQVIRPCNTYIEAAGALPAAEEKLDELIDKRAEAEDTLLEERDLLSAVEKVLKHLPEEE